MVRASSVFAMTTSVAISLQPGVDEGHLSRTAPFEIKTARYRLGDELLAFLESLCVCRYQTPAGRLQTVVCNLQSALSRSRHVAAFGISGTRQPQLRGQLGCHPTMYRTS
jgi:hypothetical protein